MGVYELDTPSEMLASVKQQAKEIEGAAMENAAAAARYRHPGRSHGLGAFRIRPVHDPWDAGCQCANASSVGAKAALADRASSSFVADDLPQPDGIFRCDRRVGCAIDTAGGLAARQSLMSVVGRREDQVPISPMSEFAPHT
jgi:hypothetical protein